MGGKHTNACKDNKLRSEVYTDIYNQIKREFGLYDNNGKFVSYKALKRRYISEAHKLIETTRRRSTLKKYITAMHR